MHSRKERQAITNGTAVQRKRSSAEKNMGARSVRITTKWHREKLVNRIELHSVGPAGRPAALADANHTSKTPAAELITDQRRAACCLLATLSPKPITPSGPGHPFEQPTCVDAYKERPFEQQPACVHAFKKRLGTFVSSITSQTQKGRPSGS